MPRITLDVFHLTILIPKALPEAKVDAMARILKTAAFRRRLRHAVSQALRADPTLKRASAQISR